MELIMSTDSVPTSRCAKVTPVPKLLIWLWHYLSLRVSGIVGGGRNAETVDSINSHPSSSFQWSEDMPGEENPLARVFQIKYIREAKMECVSH